MCCVKAHLKFISVLSFAFLTEFISILKPHIWFTFPLDNTAIEVNHEMWKTTATDNSEENEVQGGPLPAEKTDSNYKKSLNFLIPSKGKYLNFYFHV